MVNIKIDGKDHKAKADATIYDTLKEIGTDVPLFCDDKLLKAFGACRLCIVEVENKGYVPSCSFKVFEGMSVKTVSDNISDLRKKDLELLLSDHHADCIAPCQEKCPAHIDIQGYIALVHNKNYYEAVKLIKEKVPFPAVLGRVCPHPCEEECRRTYVDKAVSICKLKRSAADSDLESQNPYMPVKEGSKNKRIAVIGAGPAGLSAAFYLAIKGYSVNVFEKMPEAGGMLRYGIPSYRLPRKILDKEIALILALGIEIKYNTEFGRDVTIDSLKKDGFDSILIAIGAWKSRNQGIEGEDLDFAMQGIDLTIDLGLNCKVKVGDRIVVIGGGNTAIDVARNSLRLGAKDVKIIYRRSRTEMPASPEEVEAAEHEGVKIEFLSLPVKLFKRDGKNIVTCQKMTLCEPDASGRRSPVCVEGSDYDLEVDNLFFALGQIPDTDNLKDYLKTSRGGVIQVNESYVTSKEGVFASGDVVTGAATVVEACGSARITAESIDQFLQGREIKRPFTFNSKKELTSEEESQLGNKLKLPREVPKELKPSERTGNFKEVESVFTELESRRESTRCLECGCKAYFDCKLKDYSQLYNARQKRYEGRYNFMTKDSSHPFIEKDFNKCILCAKCVRICDERWGASVWGFINRGFSVQIESVWGKPLLESNCESCGYCVDMCPTGALISKRPFKKVAPYEGKQLKTICSYCSSGCEFELFIRGNEVYKAQRINTDSDGELSLCAKGKFLYGYVNSEEKYVVNEDALKINIFKINQKLSEINAKYGNGSIAFFAGKRLTNEELFIIRKLADAYGVKYMNSFSEFDREEKIDIVFNNMQYLSDNEDLKNASLVIANYEVINTSPLLKAKLREKMKNGQKVIMAGKYLRKYNSFFKRSFVNSDISEIVAKNTAENIVILIDFKGITRSETERIFQICKTRSNIKIMPVFEKCNSLGFYMFTQGKRHTSDLIKSLNEGKIRSLVIFGEDPLELTKEREKVNRWFNSSELTVVFDIFRTKTMKKADIPMPMSNVTNSGGSYINMEGKYKFNEPVFDYSLSEYNNHLWKILTDILSLSSYKDKLMKTDNITSLNEIMKSENGVFSVDKDDYGVLINSEFRDIKELTDINESVEFIDACDYIEKRAQIIITKLKIKI
jgi:formate dehydrogenase major subunit